MPDPSAINTWPAVAAFALALLALQIPGLVATFRTRRDTRVIREHTENEHQGAEHPNMRDEITAGRRASEAAAAAAQRAVEIAEATEQRLSEHVSHAELVDRRRDEWQTAVEDDLSRLRRPILSWRH